MKALMIALPDECAPISKDLNKYFVAMVEKAAKNMHKGRWPNLDGPKALANLKAEVEELRQAILSEGDREVELEAADVGVTAMILADVAITNRIKARKVLKNV